MEDFRSFIRTTMSFLLRPLEVNTSDLNFSPFTGIDEAALQLEFKDLKTKDLWSSKFRILTAELEDLERQNLPLQYNTNGLKQTTLKSKVKLYLICGIVYHRLVFSYKHLHLDFCPFSDLHIL